MTGKENTCDQLTNIRKIQGKFIGDCSFVERHPWALTHIVPDMATNLHLVVRGFATVRNKEVVGMDRSHFTILEARALCSAAGSCKEQMGCNCHQDNRPEQEP